MKTLFILAVAFALFVGTAARATPTFGTDSMDLFWHACTDQGLVSECQEYISGTLDTLYYAQDVGTPLRVAGRFCIPDNTPFGTVVAEVRSQMRALPVLRTETDSPTLLISAILEHRWPCNPV